MVTKVNDGDDLPEQVGDDVAVIEEVAINDDGMRPDELVADARNDDVVRAEQDAGVVNEGLSNLLSEILSRVEQLPGWEEYSDEDKTKLNTIGHKLGRIIEHDLYKDSNACTTSYKNYVKESLDKLNWVKERNTLLTIFFERMH